MTTQIKNMIKDGGAKRKYILVGRPSPTKTSGYDCVAGNYLGGLKYLDLCKATDKRESVDINEVIKKELLTNPNIYFADVNNQLCSADSCLNHNEHQAIYTDKAHLSTYGASIAFNEILNTIKIASSINK